MKLFKRPKNAKTQYWYGRARIRGKDRWVSSRCLVGKYTKEEAEEKINERLEKLKNPPPITVTTSEKVFTSDNPTMFEVAKKFIEKKQINNKYSWHTDLSILNGCMNFLGADTPVNRINSRDIDDLKKELQKTKLDTTVNHNLKVLRAFFNQAKAWGAYPGPDPVKESGMITIKDIRERRQYTKDEIKRLLAASPEYFKDWINGARWCGMRRTELWKAHESHLNFKEKYIYVPPSKSAAPRQIPLEPPAIAMFERLAKNSWNGYLFLNRHGARFSFPPVQVSKIFNRIRIRTKIADGCFHSLRHTAASKIVNRGGPLNHTQYLLGHKNIKTTMIYTHIDESIRKTATLLYDDDE